MEYPDQTYKGALGTLHGNSVALGFGGGGLQFGLVGFCFRFRLGALMTS